MAAIRRSGRGLQFAPFGGQVVCAQGHVAFGAALLAGDDGLAFAGEGEQQVLAREFVQRLARVELHVVRERVAPLAHGWQIGAVKGLAGLGGQGQRPHVGGHGAGVHPADQADAVGVLRDGADHVLPRGQRFVFDRKRRAHAD